MSSNRPPDHDVVTIGGTTFTMGSDAHQTEEAPAHRVTVTRFVIDRHPVTNAQFGAFVEATGYVTVAERPLDPADFPGAPPENLVPGSMVFTATAGPVPLDDLSAWWRWQPAASWRRPEGPSSSLTGREDHPVVHVACEDAESYARWIGAHLPTEAQWECAARGGLDGAAYAWGDEARPDGRSMANMWEGDDFPWRHRTDDHWPGTSPVGSFPPNGFGLLDMTGNVWEWTSDWYRADHGVASDEAGVDDCSAKAERACCVPTDPRGGSVGDSFDPAAPQFRIPRRVIKGGSHLCADTYCRRYRPAARRPQMVDTGMSHIGFRCAWPADDETDETRDAERSHG